MSDQPDTPGGPVVPSIRAMPAFFTAPHAASWPRRPLRNRLAPSWRFRSHRPDAAVLDWIQDSGSLTARLIALADGDFRVRVTRLRWMRPRRDEALQLQASRCEWALIREVVLEGGGQPWVCARSVIPRGSLQGANAQIRQLGSRPLGAFLFRDPSLQRDQIHVLRTHDGHWGRCSRFLLRGKPLLVAEYFLPALLARRAP